MVETGTPWLGGAGFLFRLTGDEVNEEQIAKLKECRIQARVNALESVNKLNLPKLVDLNEDCFLGLGLKTTREACKNLESLRELHGQNLPYLIGLSLREVWFALFDGSGFVAMMTSAESDEDNDHTHKLEAAESFGEEEGIAWSLCNNLSDIQESQQQASFRDGTTFSDRLSSESILKGAAMYWFAAAAASYRDGNLGSSFGWLNEAQDAMSLAHGNCMWDEGAKLERESATENFLNSLTEARSMLGRIGSDARHAETRSMKADAFIWLDTKMPYFKSMDAAALALTKQQPIVFRTARDWVGEWKKIRSASKP